VSRPMWGRVRLPRQKRHSAGFASGRRFLWVAGDARAVRHANSKDARPHPDRLYSWSMASNTGSSHERSWRDHIHLDAAAESMHMGKLRVLQSASRIGEELSRHLAEIPLFVFGEQTPSRLKRVVEHWSKRITIRSIVQLVVHRKRVKATLQEIPIRMQLVTNQVRLVLELIDDFAEGTYRDVPWHSMAVAAGAVLYSVSPSDIVPDVLPLVGHLDDLFVLGIALKLIQKDLCAYALAKGYDANDYFPDSDDKMSAKAADGTQPVSPAPDAREAAAVPEEDSGAAAHPSRTY
jgi:uncharacterized membrane protein YkvA (DUF1232 family)